METLEPARWKVSLSWISAGTLAVLFLVSGVWKIADPLGWAARTSEMRVPASISLAAALFVGIAETAGAVWILVPRLRRWGSIMIGALLAAFVIYFAANYGALHGTDCGCFPWVKRVVGPGFFAGDLAMLALAVVAGLCAQRSGGARVAMVILATVTVFALVSWGVESQQYLGVRAPASVMVNGQPYSIDRGKVFLFFFNPECSHCFDVAKHLSGLEWGDTRLVAVPTEEPQYGASFLQQTGLKAVATTDFPKLKAALGYTSYPFAAVIENGRVRVRLTAFDGAEPEMTLRRLNVIH